MGYFYGPDKSHRNKPDVAAATDEDEEVAADYPTSAPLLEEPETYRAAAEAISTVSTSANMQKLPCDRGYAPGGPRGLHYFQAGVNGAICCIYCGKRGSGESSSIPQPVYQPPLPNVYPQPPYRVWCGPSGGGLYA